MTAWPSGSVTVTRGIGRPTQVAGWPTAGGEASPRTTSVVRATASRSIPNHGPVSFAAPVTRLAMLTPLRESATESIAVASRSAFRATACGPMTPVVSAPKHRHSTPRRSLAARATTSRYAAHSTTARLAATAYPMPGAKTSAAARRSSTTGSARGTIDRVRASGRPRASKDAAAGRSSWSLATALTAKTAATSRPGTTAQVPLTWWRESGGSGRTSRRRPRRRAHAAAAARCRRPCGSRLRSR